MPVPIQPQRIKCPCRITPWRAKARKMTVRKRGRPTADEIAEIDDAIVRSAMSNFHRLGFEAAQIAGIAAEAGVTKATLYKRYESKAHILAAAVNRSSETLLAELAAVADTQSEPLSALRSVLSAFLKACLAERYLTMNRLIVATASFDPVVHARMAVWRRRFDGLVRTHIDACLTGEEGEQTADSATLTAAVIDLMINGPLNRAMRRDDALASGALADTLFEARWPMVLRLIGR